MITYYQTECGKLLAYNNKRGLYKITNDYQLKHKYVDQYDFILYQSKEITRLQYTFLMNKYYSRVRDYWMHNNEWYRSLPNFEVDKYRLTSHYFGDLPKHVIETPYKFKIMTIMVYHWGDLYYFAGGSSGNLFGVLYDIRTHEICKKVRIKDCAPIGRLTTSKII